jgi:hypothetical protein
MQVRFLRKPLSTLAQLSLSGAIDIRWLQAPRNIPRLFDTLVCDTG